MTTGPSSKFPNGGVTYKQTLESTTGAAGVSAFYSFEFDPNKTPWLEVAFHAAWLSNRLGADHSCWLALPSLLHGAGEPLANQAIGHPRWPSLRPKLALPLTHAATQINYEGLDSKLAVDSSESYPAPTSVNPASYTCNKVQSPDCGASVTLRTPGSSNTAPSRVAVWSLVGGLFLSLVVEAAVSLTRVILEVED